MIKWEKEKETLIKLITENKSYEEIGKMYGCTGSNIKKQAKKLGIELKERRRKNPKETFNKGTAKKNICPVCDKEYVEYKGHWGNCCSKECWTKFRETKYIEDWKNGKNNGCDVRKRLSPIVRRYIFQKYNNKCAICNCDLINDYTKLSILQIHHIDGNTDNSKEENLVLLCPNHHAMTENFGSRNQNSRRAYRREEYRRKEEEKLKNK